jgi:hypothetical protein
MRYENYSSIASYVEAVTTVAQQLNEIGHPIDNEELTMIMLCGLPDSFDPENEHCCELKWQIEL